MQKPAEVITSAGFPFPLTFHFARTFFAIAFTCKRFFRATLFTRFQVERVPLDFFYNIFLLYFTFKASQGAFKGLAIL